MANKPPAADDLSTLLDNYNDAKVTPPNVSGAEDEWIEKFNAHRDKVIRPAMEQLGKEIEKRGHDFHIVSRDFRRGNRPLPDEASIRIDIYLADEKTRTKINADKRPHVGFATNHKKQTVNVVICDVTSRGGVESKVAEFPLDKIDAPLIRDKFVALFKRLIAA
jgi:hypothetical protein